MNLISVEELKNKSDKGELIYLLDVREPAEYAQQNMNGKLLPLSQISNFQTDEIESWKNKEVVVQCRSGARSMQACMLLEQQGFTNVYNLTGGILAWTGTFGDVKPNTVSK